MWRLTKVTGGVQNSNSLQAQLHILMTLPHLVRGGQVCLVVPIRRRDDVRRPEGAAVLGPFIPAGCRIRIHGVLRRVITAVIRAVRTVDGVEEVVEGRPLDQITHLVQDHLLRIHQRHGVLEVEVRLAVEVKAGVRLLDHASVDGIQLWSLPDLLPREVGEEEIEILGPVGLRRVLNDAVLVAGRRCDARREGVEGAQAVGRDHGVAMLQLRDDVVRRNLAAGLREGARVRPADAVGDAGLHVALAERVAGAAAAGDELGVEVDRGHNQVDVLAEVRGDAVGLAGDVGLAERVVVDVILSLQQRLDVRDRSVHIDPGLAGRKGNAVTRDPEFNQPRGNRGYGLFAALPVSLQDPGLDSRAEDLVPWGECVSYLLWRPVLGISTARRIGDAVEERIRLVEVALLQANAKR